MTALAGILVAIATAAPAAAGTPTVRAGLVSDGSRVGVRFVIPRGKHIYWSNPGDSGLPTKVVFSLPPGYRAGPVWWPVPGKFVQPGDIAGFGYDRELLLWTDLEMPAGGGNPGWKVGATVTWLECDNRECVAGRAELASAWPPPAIMGLFGRWSAKLPESGATAKPGSAAGSWEISIPWGGRGGKIRWVAAADPRVAVADVAIRKDGDRMAVVCTVGPVPGASLPRGDYEIMAAYSSFWSGPKGVAVRVPAGGAGK
jgi:hypothetical protein